METKKKKQMSSNEDVIYKLEEMDNKLEEIRSSTHSLDRVTCIANAPVIKVEIWKVVKRSEVRAAILFLTRDEISAQDLVQALGIEMDNLSRDMKPFINRGFIYELNPLNKDGKKSRKKNYRRSEQIDLVAFEKEQEFVELIESWKTKRLAHVNATSNISSKNDTPLKEKANA